jgi:hypothetical protein
MTPMSPLQIRLANAVEYALAAERFTALAFEASRGDLRDDLRRRVRAVRKERERLERIQRRVEHTEGSRHASAHS